jgi:hypothetical protein
MSSVNWAQKLPQSGYKSAKTKIERLRFQGGYNTETPPLEMPPGHVTDPLNFEIDVDGGYRRIKGYERYDGKTSPSTATFSTLPATVSGSYSVGDTITGVTSGATSIVIADNVNGFIVTKVSGTYTDTEDLQISASSVGTCTGAQYSGGATTPLLQATYLNLAADQYRADVAAVPGSGSVLGVNIYNTVVYAFRNKSGDATAGLYKETTSGWSEIDLGDELEFDTGSTEIAVGDTVTGATSGASGVVTGIAARTGTWGGNNVVGILTFASISSGPFSSGENLQVSAATVAVSTAASAEITLNPNGRYQFINYNFYGSAGTFKMYGADGANYAFEFDGTTYIPIRTGMTVDTPLFITAHKKHLFLSFGASLQHSSTGVPYGWSAVTGAAELGLGDTVTGLYPQVGAADAGGVLLATSRNKTHTLYGNSIADWNLVETEPEAGAIAYTLQKVGYTYMLDDRGVRQYGSTQSFGNFAQSTMSKLIQSHIAEKLTRVKDSMISKTTNQYRLFFNDSSALYMTVFNNKVIGFMPIQLSHVVECSISGETTTGAEGLFFGSDNGFVYQMEKGTSFDGDAIEYSLEFTPHHLKSPDIDKRFKKCALEVKGEAYLEFSFGYILDYRSDDREQPGATTVTKNLSSFTWDEFTWDDFFWDSRSLEPEDLKLEGSGRNIALSITGTSEVTATFTLTGALIHFTLRKIKRS